MFRILSLSLLSFLLAGLSEAVADPGTQEGRSESRRDESLRRDDERRTRPGANRWTARRQAAETQSGSCASSAERGRSTHRRWASGLDSPRTPRHDEGRGRRDTGTRAGGGDRRVVVLAGDADRRQPYLVSDPVSTRLLFEHVSARDRRSDGLLAFSDAGGDRLRSSDFGGRARTGSSGATDCRAPGTVVASSGDLYLRVRADGSLEIRAR